MLFVALLRGINVGRHVRIGMSELREMLAELGCVRPQTLLQSGNLVFEDATRSRADLEPLLETQIERRFRHRIDCFVRTAPEWGSVVANNPYAPEAQRDPAHVVAMLLKEAPSPQSVEALRSSLAGPELVTTCARTAYVFYPVDIGRSRVTNAYLETALGTRGTARNWNTVVKVAARLGEN